MMKWVSFRNRVRKNIIEEASEGSIPEFQLGFRAKHSTVDALSLVAEGELAKERGEVLGLCSMDISKAFDSVWQDGLIYKLAMANLEESTCKLIDSFLQNRTAIVKIEENRSRKIRIERGVPQGSRLGPILYNFYVGDLKVRLNNRAKIVQYADDTMLMQRSVNGDKAAREIGDTFGKVTKFLNNWGIEVNGAKTEIVFTVKEKGRTRAMVGKKIVLGPNVVEAKKDLVYLGVTIDRQLLLLLLIACTGCLCRSWLLFGVMWN